MMRRPTENVLHALWLSTVAMALAGCGSTLPNRDPTGELFPTVTGQSLDEQTVTLPDDLNGEPSVLIVGYTQNAQFDIDRWLLGMLQAELSLRILEVPTIPGALASMASGFIDDGMRSGIPREDWKVVVTLYGGAAKPVAKLTGTENGNSARVLVLDADGRIVWFHDAGYSAREMIELLELADQLGDQSVANGGSTSSAADTASTSLPAPSATSD